MNLFGCKFCEEVKRGKGGYGDDNNDGPKEENCDRKNFDSLLWATVTVFQVSCYFVELFYASYKEEIIFLNKSLLILGFNPGGLEHCSLLGNAKNQPLGCTVLRGLNDLWKLRSVQLTGGHLGGRIF